MTGPDLSATPYGLDDDALGWVRSTIDAMDEDEKVGQLFINLNNRFDDTFVNHIVDAYHPGGMHYKFGFASAPATGGHAPLLPLTMLVIPVHREQLQQGPEKASNTAAIRSQAASPANLPGRGSPPQVGRRPRRP